MSEHGSAPAVIAREYVSSAAHAMFRQAFKDWSEMLGFTGEVRDASLRVLPYSRDMLRRLAANSIVVSTLAEGKSNEPMMLVLPTPLVGSILADALMIPKASGKGVSVDWENDSHVDAVREIVNLLCGSATRALGTVGAKLRVSQSVDHLVVHREIADSFTLKGVVRIVCVKVDVAVDGAVLAVWCILPESVAAALSVGRT